MHPESNDPDGFSSSTLLQKNEQAIIPKRKKNILSPRKMFTETRREGQTGDLMFRASNEMVKIKNKKTQSVPFFLGWPITSINAGGLMKEADDFLLVTGG